LKRDDITSEFRNQSLTFNEDLTLEHADFSQGTSSNGVWEIDCDQFIIDDSVNSSADLFAFYLNSETEEFTSLNMDNIRVTKRFLRGSQRKDGGIYFYKLERE